ncbi:MAG: UDP-N-acetylmuramoyl-L-alanine--D-glutamate ligase, partial [Candidatus Portnoybacteria bacterium]
MIDYQNYFKDKKITLIGLGVLGRGVNLAKFLAELGAELTITDLKKKEELASSLNKLKKFKKIKYVLGRHRLADFKDRDMIIKAASVPFDSEYIKEAEKNKIPVEMDASLLAKLSPAKIIGITGTRGKSTITHFIHFALKKNNQRVFLGGNVRGMATLPLIKEVREKDIIILELDSWQLQGFGDSKISPHIAILTNFFPDHLNYYKNSMTRYFNDKANIFKYQNREDYLIISQQAEKEIKKRYKGKIKSRVIVSKSKFPKGWKTKLIGQHNRDNLALGIKVLEIMGIKRDSVKKAAKEYPGISGRLEFIRNFKGVSYYNDTNASSPEATIAALNSFEQNVILI